MIDVAVIVEGQTEQRFVKRLLAPHFGALGVAIWARLPGRVRRHGGVRRWDAIRDDILRTMRERPGRICTTMFDFYGLPAGWPGRQQAASLQGAARARHVEESLLADVASCSGEAFRACFVPHVQLHEFEALLLSDLEQLAGSLRPVAGFSIQSALGNSMAGAPPEEIDDGTRTAPSKRIADLCPAYRKAHHGPIIAERIGLSKMREKCPHFAAWLTRLETLASIRPATSPEP